LPGGRIFSSPRRGSLTPEMKILHTSDWHLGRTLYGRKRYEEYEAFLDWLARAIRDNGIDVLVAAGDIFDTTAPSNRAQELYYRFLCRAASLGCRHVVVVSGNHDSPSFLDAPKELLKALEVHVTGSPSESPEDEVLVLRDGRGVPELIVCAVPHLRDRDIRTAEAGESIEDKERKLLDGIRDHYAAVAAFAEEKRRELGCAIPIVATGHLFAAGGRTVEGDGVRELYVGSLGRVNAKVFPSCIDYLALGHLHVPQKVNGSETVRYSGSPLPMGFGEAKQQKSVCVAEFGGEGVSVRLVPVPVFQQLEQIRGDWDRISGRIFELASQGSRAWLEVIYEGDEILGDLRDRLEEAVGNTAMEVLRVKNTRAVDRVLAQTMEEETLDDLDEDDVFQRCIEANQVPEEQRPELFAAYREVVLSLRGCGGQPEQEGRHEN